MSKYRYTISDGTDSFQFMPTNSISITKKRVTSSIGAWYGEKSITNLQISAKRSKELYGFLSTKCLEAIVDDTGACSTMIVTLEQKQGFGQYVQKFKGLFTVRDIEHDTALCTMTVKCTEDSPMQCFLRGIDKQFNMLSINSVTNAVVTNSSNPFGFVATFGTLPADPPFAGTPTGVYWAVDQVEFPNYTGEDIDYYLILWYYEYQNTYCVGGSPVAPDSSGDWFNFTQQQTGNECGVDGTTEWRKIYTTMPVAYNTGVLTASEPASPIIYIAPNSLTGDSATGPTINYWGIQNFAVADTTNLPNGRTLTDVLFYGSGIACSEISNVASSFFSATNPITGNGTYNFMTLFQITDVKYPTADQPASRAIITMKKLLSDLNKMFDVWWYVSDEWELIIEHRTYFLEYGGSNDFIGKSKNFGTYSYNKDNFAGYKTYTTPAQSGIDFVGKQIEYSQPCTTSETENVNLELLCADARYIMAYPDKTPDEAIVIVAVTSDNHVITSNGLISNTPVTNAPLSWANLHYLFHRHNAYTLTGKLNGQTSFEDENTFLKTIQLRQGKISVLICDIDTISILAAIQTDLTRYLNISGGLIDEAKIDLDSCFAEITYSF